MFALLLFRPDVDQDDLAGVTDARNDRVRIACTAGNDHSLLVKARRVAWEQPLPGREDRVTEELPLPPVRVPCHDQRDIRIPQIGLVIFGMVAKEQAAPLYAREGGEKAPIGRRRGLGTPLLHTARVAA